MIDHKYRFVFRLLPLLLLFTATNSPAQTTRKVLFLGNSYTGVNNLPQLVRDVALSAGDTLIFDSNKPGGYTLEDHSLDATSKSKIMAGGWDYVVLQGQSQEPITHTSRFIQGGNTLDYLIAEHNPCGVTLLYMTWGRKNGDAANCPGFPVMCTYEGMDSTLQHEYLDLAGEMNAEVSPVSVVWHHLRQNNPGIELYQPDESHPSKSGTYAAACSFYAMIFKQDPTAITYNFGLPAADAAAIRNAAKTEVYDHLGMWDYKRLPRADIQYQIGAGTNEVDFGAFSHGVRQTYFWDFGDGDTSSLKSPTHSYFTNGTYTVTLTATNCDLQGLHTSTTDTVIQFCAHTPTIYTSNPWICHYDTLWTQPADAYQWYAAGSPIPETGPFLPNYKCYYSTNFSVRTIVNGCAERSQVFNANPPWTGFYFDAAWGGDPCEGDTALFIALSTNGPMDGPEIILWYKNGTLLPSATNQDTLLITTEGSYLCKVVDTTAQCPQDTTTSSPVVYDCGTLGMKPANRDVSLHLYPNPASQYITLKFPDVAGRQTIRVYNATGRLVKIVETTSPVTLNVAGWPGGLYYVRVGNGREMAVKFVKQ